MKNSSIVDSFAYTKLRNDNYVKQFNYRSAYSTSTVLTTKFGQRLSFSKNSQSATMEKNLFVDQLRAVLLLTYKGKKLPFNFDSGAKKSLFYRAFYETFRSAMDSIGTKAISKASGAGAQEISTEVLELKNQDLLIGNRLVRLPDMRIDKQDYGIYGKENYGNIGQDVIGQFKKVTISFDKNYLKLENLEH